MLVLNGPQGVGKSTLIPGLRRVVLRQPELKRHEGRADGGGEAAGLLDSWRSKKMGGMAVKFTSPGLDGVPDRIVLLPGGRLHS